MTETNKRVQTNRENIHKVNSRHNLTIDKTRDLIAQMKDVTRDHTADRHYYARHSEKQETRVENIEKNINTRAAALEAQQKQDYQILKDNTKRIEALEQTLSEHKKESKNLNKSLPIEQTKTSQK